MSLIESLTKYFTVLEPPKPPILEFYVAYKTGSTDFGALQLQDVLSGGQVCSQKKKSFKNTLRIEVQKLNAVPTV